MPLFQQSEAADETTETKEESSHPPASDPTITHAGLTEIDEGSIRPLSNGHTGEDKPSTLASTADVADSAANAAGESQWDTNNELAESQEWVNVPRDAAETETGLAATPAAPANTQSWADDHPDPAETAAAAVPTEANDGFQSVQRKAPAQNWRGRGGDRGGYRGRGGFRGDGRGRGRGGQRGGMPNRGPRRGGAGAADES